MSESSVSRSVPDGLSFSIGARASSPRGLRDGVSLCSSLGVTGIIIIREEKIGEEKIRSGRTVSA